MCLKATNGSEGSTATKRVPAVSGRDASLPVHYASTYLAWDRGTSIRFCPERRGGESRRRELNTGDYAAGGSHPFSCSFATAATRSVAVLPLPVDQILSCRLSEGVRRLVLLVDQHVRIVPTQKRLSHRGRAKSQIEVTIIFRQSRARRLVDGPQQARSDTCGLERAAVDDHDPDSRNRLAG